MGKKYEDAEDMAQPLPVNNSTPGFSALGVSPGKKKSGSLLGSKRRLRDLERFGFSGKWFVYYTDIFHTMLNMPRPRFLLVFFLVYLMEYVLFGLLYWSVPDKCIGEDNFGVSFAHALWFSVSTAATLGYTGKLAPNPDCPGINILIIVQVITASLIDYILMGLVFARFASPDKRAITVRFSSSATMTQRESDGLWELSFRVANVRKHALLKPEMTLSLSLPVNPGEEGLAGSFRFYPLLLENLESDMHSLRLGLPAHLHHVIRPGTPLYDMSLAHLEACGGELVCFLDGVDPMTSNMLQAQHAYTPHDIRINERFVPMDVTRKGGRTGLDFSVFDATAVREGTVHDLTNGMPQLPVSVLPGGQAAGTGSNGGMLPGQAGSVAGSGDVHVHISDLRSHTIRSLTPLESAAHAGGSSSGGGAVSLESEVRELCDAVMADPCCGANLKRRAALVRALQPSSGLDVGRGSLARTAQSYPLNFT